MEREELNDAMTDFDMRNHELEMRVKKLESRNVELVSRNLELENQLNTGSNPMGFEKSRVTASEGDDDEDDDYDDHNN